MNNTKIENFFLKYAEIVSLYKYASQLVARQRVFKCKSRLIQLIQKDRRYTQYKNETWN